MILLNDSFEEALEKLLTAANADTLSRDIFKSILECHIDSQVADASLASSIQVLDLANNCVAELSEAKASAVESFNDAISAINGIEL